MKSPRKILYAVLVFLVLAFGFWGVWTLTHQTTETYTLDYEMEALSSTELELHFHIENAWGAKVKNFEAIHEKPLHLIGVRTDFREFLHLHPEMEADGTWVTTIDFPAPGPYQFYADFTPLEGEAQVLPFTLSIGEFERKELMYYPETQTFGDYEFAYTWPSLLISGTETMFSLSAQKGEESMNSYEDYLGAKGHSVIINVDTYSYQHVHPTSETEPAFAVTFEEAGTYAVFTQVQIGGELFTIPYMLTVEAGEGSESMDHNGH